MIPFTPGNVAAGALPGVESNSTSVKTPVDVAEGVDLQF
jgi:hypothetical protein